MTYFINRTLQSFRWCLQCVTLADYLIAGQSVNPDEFYRVRWKVKVIA